MLWNNRLALRARLTPLTVNSIQELAGKPKATRKKSGPAKGQSIADGHIRNALTLIFEQGLSIEEAAKLTGRRETSIRSAFRSATYTNHLADLKSDQAVVQSQMNINRLIDIRENAESQTTKIKAIDLLQRLLDERLRDTGRALKEVASPGYMVRVTAPDGTKVELHGNTVKPAPSDTQSEGNAPQPIDIIDISPTGDAE